MSLPVSDDAISRKWVLNEIITKVEDDDSLTGEQKGSLSVAKYIIRHAPPVEPKLPTGEWVKATGVGPPEFTGRYVCSNCGSYALMNMPYGSRQELSPFCPNCRADMRGGTGKGRVDGTDAD